MAYRGGLNRHVERPPVVVPPALYLPTVRNARTGEVEAVVKKMADGRRGLLAYTALDRLADRCGYEQPWMLLMTSELDRIMQTQPFDVVAFDIDIPDAHRDGGRLA